MELLVLSSIFFIVGIFLFVKPTKHINNISEKEASSLFFDNAELTTDREINGAFTRGMSIHESSDDKVTITKQAKLCDISILQ